MTGEEQAIKEGYCPHSDNKVVCTKCGSDLFISLPQGVVADAEVWGYEFICERCGRRVTIYVKRQ